jgi:amino acid adenylation domain-containing protein
MQRQLWLFERFSTGNPALNVSMRWQLDGDVTAELLEKAFRNIIDRHQALRTRFVEVDGEPYQKVETKFEFRLEFSDLMALSQSDQLTEIERIGRLQASRPFRLTELPLLRASLLRLSARCQLLLVTAHHTIFDGCSKGILSREIGEASRAIVSSRPPLLPELKLQFGDYSRWQRAWVESDALRPLTEYWEPQLANFKYFEVPTDFARPAVRTSEVGNASILLPRSLSESLQRLAERSKATLYMTTLAGLMTTLSRVTGETDIAIGTQVTGRHDVDLEDLIGCFVNTLVVRCDLSGDPTFDELLAQTREKVQGAIDHGEMPTRRLIEMAHQKLDASRNPLFSVNYMYQQGAEHSTDYDVFRLTNVPTDSPGTFYDLNFLMVEGSQGWCLSCEYNVNLFEAATVERVLSYYERVLENVVCNPFVRLTEVELLSDRERHLQVSIWNQTQAPYPQEKTLPRLLEEQADRSPDAIAVVHGKDGVTYKELDSASNRLARYLRRLGVGSGQLVGICLDRSVEMVVSLVAVMKAGAAYVPLDPYFPPARLDYMVQDSQVSVIITKGPLPANLSCDAARTVDLATQAVEIAGEDDRRLGIASVPQDLAYVIYTSGSTGQPKGVQIRQQNLVNLLWAMRSEPGLSAHDTLVAVTTISFDIAALELFLPLLVGARLVIASRKEAADGAALLGVLRRFNATVLQATPITWRLLIEAGWTGEPQLKMLCGGEALQRSLADQLLARGGELWNMYGPTETTIWSTGGRVCVGQGKILLGRPIANTQLYVLDPRGELCPIGVAGELVIGGDGVASGYRNLDKLTQARFIVDQFRGGSGRRLYRTGDIVRRNADGGLEFLGRADHQIKLRGFRIELGEIESVLNEHPAVRESAVVVRQDSPGDLRLVGYVRTGREVRDLASELRGLLRQKLPDYMVPTVIIALESFPLTPNGKLDRDRLPHQSAAGDQGHRTSIYRRLLYGSARASRRLAQTTIVPRDEYETLLADIWKDIFGLSTISIHDDFFFLGGNSLVAARLASLLEKRSGIALDLSTLIVRPTIADLAKAIRLTHLGETDALIVPLRATGIKRPLFCMHPSGGHLLHYVDLVKALPESQPIYGLRPPSVEQLRHILSVERLASIYVSEIKKVQGDGPYQLCGMSFGGLIAYEVACQLVDRGADVKFVALFDTPRPGHRSQTASQSFLSWADYIGYLLKKYNDLGNVREITESIGRSIQIRTRMLTWRAARHTCRLLNLPVPALMHSMVDTFDSLGRSYRPRRFGGSVVLLQAQDSEEARNGDTTALGWNEVTDAGVKIHIVPGDHISMMRPPHIARVAEQLEAYLATEDERLLDEGRAKVRVAREQLLSR